MRRFLHAVLLLGVVAALEGPVIQTSNGPIQGTRDIFTGFTTYHGVPFASPPTGNNRWRAPSHPAPWTSTLQTHKAGPQCPQLDFVRGFHIGHEDCLYASVYVPPVCDKGGCPVMQWIYGGAWSLGSNEEFGLYDGTKVASQHGVIIVAANYRLDTLGWLAMQELQEEAADGSYGNYGIKDQQFALAWTQANIAKFGGDPDRVTVFGESAGAFSVCQHIVSPASNGLFSHAIMESGDCDGPWLIVDGVDAKVFGDSFAGFVGCKSEKNGDAAQRLACLRSLPIKDILEPYTSWLCLFKPEDDPYCNHTKSSHHSTGTSSVASSAAASQPAYDSEAALRAVRTRHKGVGTWPIPVPPMAPVCAWTAVVDGSASGLPDTPYNLIKAGKINRSPKGEKISVIMGTNQDEMALFVVMLPAFIPHCTLPPVEKDLRAIADHLVQYHDNWNSSLGDDIINAYPASAYPNAGDRIITAGTDFIFRCGTRSAARALSAAGIDTYLYHFNYHFAGYIDPAEERCQRRDEFLCGIYHSSELKFVWDKVGLFASSADKSVASTFGTLWTNMAKFGTPNAPPGAGSNAVSFTWPAYNESTDMHLEITESPSAKSGLAKATCDFWDAMPNQGPYPH